MLESIFEATLLQSIRFSVISVRRIHPPLSVIVEQKLRRTAKVRKTFPVLRHIGKSLFSFPRVHKFDFSAATHVLFLLLTRLLFPRGCTRGCRFCQPGMLTRPARDVPPEDVVQAVEEGMRRTGYNEFSLLSLSCSDYLALPAVGLEVRVSGGLNSGYELRG